MLLKDNEEALKHRDLNCVLDTEYPFIRFNWQYFMRIIWWRFLEISNRIFLLVLIWLNLGGLAFSIIISAELLTYIVLCVYDKSYVYP